MSDDLLKQYTSAFKEEFNDGSSAFPEATRARVIRSLAERRPRRAKWWAIGIPTLALFAGSTAWAAASGRLDAIVERAGVALGIVVEPGAKAPTRSAQSGKRHSKGAQALKPALVVAPSALAPSSPVPEAIAPPLATPALAPSDPKGPHPGDHLTPAESQAQLDSQLQPDPQMQARHQEEAAAIAAYQQAHTAQFGRGDCAAALDAYTNYLTHYPRGRFVMEAQYNRALCLLKTGQLQEGRAALLPFAHGAFGAYRQDQARALLDALEGTSVGTTAQAEDTEQAGQ